MMCRIPLKSLALGLACLLAAPAGADQITYQMVTVGDPGNANDTGGSGIGRVDYSYQIGKYDVTIGQYTTFLNAVDPTGTSTNGIFDVQTTGIGFNSGAADGSKFILFGSPNLPATKISWFSAARFANWMTNGQGNGSTETGAYTLNGATSGDVVAANPGAAFRLPTENEWYKAAYYSPNYGGSGVPGYYKYATQSDSPPGNTVGGGANQANYYNGVYSVTQSNVFDSNQVYLTDVGAFSNSPSFYGTFDQSGNVYQWHDLDGTAGTYRGLRGGTWNDVGGNTLTSSTYLNAYSPEYRGYDVGFRLASPVASPVPEIDPNSLGSVLALVLGSLGLLERRRLKAA
jgi:sulfatase modifying factor 1